MVADIGSAYTRLVLIDLVEGQYRLIASSRAHTTAEPPLNRVSLGLDHAAQSGGEDESSRHGAPPGSAK